MAMYYKTPAAGFWILWMYSQLHGKGSRKHSAMRLSSSWLLLEHSSSRSSPPLGLQKLRNTRPTHWIFASFPRSQHHHQPPPPPAPVREGTSKVEEEEGRQENRGNVISIYTLAQSKFTNLHTQTQTHQNTGESSQNPGLKGRRLYKLLCRTKFSFTHNQWSRAYTLRGQNTCKSLKLSRRNIEKGTHCTILSLATRRKSVLSPNPLARFLKKCLLLNTEKIPRWN